MRRFRILTILAAIMLLAAVSYVYAEVPQLMNYQGRLTDNLGQPLDTTVSMTFTVYDDSTGGTAIWTETHPTVVVTKGGFNVLLGEFAAAPDTIFSDPERYLGIVVGSDPEITPRTQLVTVPYSYRVGTVDGASGGIIKGAVGIIGDETAAKGPANVHIGGVNPSPGGALAYYITDPGFGPWPGALSIYDGTSLTPTILLDGGAGKATIGPGHINTGTNSFVAGANNIATGDFSTVGGGYGNDVAVLCNYGTIGGGLENQASGTYATIGGGHDHVASGYEATIGGGRTNISSSSATTVGGGAQNEASGLFSTVGGGAVNKATVGPGSTVAGGQSNLASNNDATVGGGSGNTASGVGATVPGGSLNTASGALSLAAGNNANADHDRTFVWNDGSAGAFSSTNTNQFLIHASNGVGIGTNNPSVELHVVGDICYTGAIGACSDVRYKKDIEQIGAALETITQLRGVTYNWKLDEYPNQKFDDQTHLGFIAQEIKDLLPGVVMTDDNGYMSVDYSRLTPVLVEAMKELKTENDELRGRLAKIEALLEQLADNQ